MSKIAESFNKVCELVRQKNQVGFGFTSPQAKELEAALDSFEEGVANAGVIPADWTHKSSIGKGNLASVMWVVFLPPGQTTQDGIYVSICFGKAGNGLVAGCAISNTSQKKYSPFVKTVDRGQSPVVDVDGTRRGTHYNNGYVNPLEVIAGAVDENAFLKHLKDSVPICLKAIADFEKTKGKAVVMLVDSGWQVITYGAPGTGKSHEIDKCTNESNSIRVTFHPDTDYAAFVGAYKPTMDELERYALDAMGTTHKIEAKEKSIVYSFAPQAFMTAYVEAWRRYTNASLQGDAKIYYLVIEEINRGNCAQIFGDLFQLLDRADNGFSAYAITPDDDIQKFLATDKDYKLSDIPLAEDIKKVTETGEKVIATAADIKVGKKLVLPPNLFIRATMNTSDQSLFPMDSAFKRRWDWKYVPIKNANLGWEIVVGDCEVDWWKFLVEINKIVKGVTNSADKQLGYFFVKAKDSVIDAEMFVNKVAFYLWNDVFKDCELDGEAFKIEREGGEVDVLAFQDFFKEDGTINEEVLKNFLTKLVPQPETAPGESEAGPAADGEA